MRDICIADTDTLLVLLAPKAEGRLPGNGGGETTTTVFLVAGCSGKGPSLALSCAIDFGHFLGDGLRPWELGGRGGRLHLRTDISG